VTGYKGKSDVTAKIDLLRRANGKKGGRFLRSDIAAAAAVRDDSYALSAAQLRWHRLITWLLVSAVVLWDIEKTFGH
jgi:hypothetical protein